MLLLFNSTPNLHSLILDHNCVGVIAGGFGSYLLGLNKRTYEQAGVDTEGNVPGSYKEPGIGWITGFLFTVSFAGLLALVPFRKVLASSYFQSSLPLELFLSLPF